MRDLLTDENVLVMDRGLGETAKGGLCLATRLVRFPNFGINMTSGASMMVEATMAADMVDDIQPSSAEVRRRAWPAWTQRRDLATQSACFETSSPSCRSEIWPPRSA